MIRLDDFKKDTFSQFGEDGVIDHIFETIGTRSLFAVEFGAGDGLSCANTANLWHEQDWSALLVEADVARHAQLVANTEGFDKVICLQAMVTPTGPSSITELIAQRTLPCPDLLSIDIDGDDWLILEALGCEPRVISIEFNPTIPPHIAMRQSGTGSGFGASLLSLIRSAAKIDYVFVGATYCNAFLVNAVEAQLFTEYETDPSILFSPDQYTYAVTDFHGRLALVGQVPPWQANDPMVEPLEASAYITPATTDAEYIRRAFERLHGPAVAFSAAGLAPDTLVSLLEQEAPGLVCIDLNHGTLSAIDWMRAGAAATNYRTQQIGQVLAFVRNN